MNRYSTIISLWIAVITSAFAISNQHAWIKMESDPRTIKAESQLPPSTEIWGASYHSGIKGAHSGIILWKTSNEVTVALQGKGGWKSTALEGPRAINLWTNIENRTRKMEFIPKDAKIYHISDAALGWCVRRYKTAPSQMSATEYHKYLQSAPKIEGCLSEGGKQELTAIFESIQDELGVPVPSNK